MARVQVDLPADLFLAVERLGLDLAELLEAAVRTELRSQEPVESIDDYLRELVEEVGEPSPEEQAVATAVVSRLLDARTNPQG